MRSSSAPSERARSAFARRALAPTAALVLSIALVPFSPFAPQAAHADPQFPSWAEVQASAANAATKQAEITKLTGLLTQLETTSAQLGEIAAAKGEAYLDAQAKLQTATQKVQKLTGERDAAEKKADASRKQAAALIAQMSHVGGGDVTTALFGASAGDADTMLHRLSLASRVSSTASEILERAEYDRNAASSLADQADDAEKERQKRQDAAAAALESAQQAATAAQQQVDATQAQSTTAYAQLASLNNQTAALNQQYLQGVAYQKAQEALAQQQALAARQKAAAAAAAAAAPKGGSTSAGGSGSVSGASSGTPTTIDSSAPNSSAVATAIAFAKAQLGDPYQLAAAGPNAWDCSGLTMMAYSAAGVYIGGHGATLQYNYLQAHGRLVPISQLQAGDLVFYNATGDPGASKDHVAIYLGGGMLIEAPRVGVPVRIWPMYTAGRVPYAGRPTG